MDGEVSDDRLSRIEERLERIERLAESASQGDERRPDPEGDGEPLDVEKAQERLDALGQRIAETRREALGREAATDGEAETKDPGE